jgi:zinc protease
MRLAPSLSRSLALASLAFATATPAVAQRAQANGNSAINIPVEKFTLPNGLTVLLSPDRTTPTVAVDVWYYVGSKNEVPGRTGFAHLFEHVMFTGSGNVAYGLHDRYTEGVGGFNNGSTNNDRTNYYESIPANYLETALWLEADRMGFLLDKLDSAKFAAQRDIVQNERRQGVDNRPYGRAGEILTTALYPASNPYSWPVVGYLPELQAASLNDVKEFFRLYYAPSNATIAIVGDFDPAQAKQFVTKYFSDLPRGKPITRPNALPPRLTTEKRLVYEDRVQIPNLFIRWPTVGLKHSDDLVLDVVALMLAPSRTARLTKTLVYDKQAAASVNAGQGSREQLGDFGINAVPRPGHTLASLEATIDSVIERFKHEGPTAEEMQRALAGIEFQFVAGLESTLGKAETLLNGSVIHNDPSYYRTQYNRMRSITAADVKRVANTYLGPGRVVLSIVPMGKIDMASKPEASTKVTVAPDGARYIMENR